MKIADLGELRDEVSWRVDFNATQTDQDFRGPSGDANRRIDRQINLAYRDEVERAKQVRENQFKRKHSFTWTANASTLDIPAGLVDKRIIRIQDNTDVNPGPVLSVWEEGAEGYGFYVYDNDTWGWYPAPSGARTLAATYMADAEWLEADSDEPVLIPRRHRELLVLSTCIKLHQVAPVTNSETFKMWVMEQDRMRFAWHKEVARGSPAETPPTSIRNQYPDINEQH